MVKQWKLPVIATFMITTAACLPELEKEDSKPSDFFSVSENGGAETRLTASTLSFDPLLVGFYDTTTSNTIISANSGLNNVTSTYGKTLAIGFSGMPSTGAQTATLTGTAYVLTPGTVNSSGSDTYTLDNTSNTGGTITITKAGPVGEAIAGSYNITLCNVSAAVSALSDCANPNFQKTFSGSFSVTRSADQTN